MYKRVLVEPEIREGDRLLQALDDARFPITAAFWLYSDDADEWRLVIVSPTVSNPGPRQAYALVDLTLNSFPDAPINIPTERIYLLTPFDLRYKEIRSAALGGSTGLGLAKGPTRNLSMEDAYVYRMS